MSRSIKLITAAIFLLLLVAQVECRGCTPSSISVEQTNTGKMAGGIDTVFQVTVTNRCRCAVNNVYLRSNGFSSSNPVDPKLFRRAGSGYLLGDGRRIPSSKSITFQYAWDHYFKMAPASVQAQC
ncbi:uncharacterized protein LOC120663340 [Panicum virgatum]|uniref:Uncharacterized protein n=1 Tax=Panicum virgatum TaxID=38727 RepID=A0A8T0UFD4_PANVG|nr:uncharacterized protein LOC120663340 [Panicum virgatum]KAG2620675.1 hypothetical protein PVAP13_3NG210800 [Panicum virgatum]